jgi:glutathione S-transferase
MPMKIIYFNVKGRAENSRIILAEGKVAYEDYRFPANSDADTNPTKPNEAFAAMKAAGKLPFGQVPALELEDGRIIVQARTIERFCAKKAGLYPADEFDAAVADSVVEACNDLQTVAVKTMFGDDAAKAAGVEAMKAFMPKCAAQFTALLEKSGSGFYTKEISYADIVAFSIWTMLDSKSEGKVFGMLPQIKAHCDAIGARPNIKAWLETRPVTAS